MDREHIVGTLKAHEAELRAGGVVALSLFGSVARGEPNPQDVDVAVRLSDAFSEGGFDYFYRFRELQRNLRTLLQCEVDVVREPASKARLQEEIERDRARVF